MPKEQTTKIWLCNICGGEFHIYEDAEKCESTHERPTKIIKSNFYKNHMYPTTVSIAFGNNRIVQYGVKRKRNGPVG